MEDLIVRFLSEEEYATWDTFVESSPYGSIFHKSYWNRAVYANDPAFKLNVIACLKKDRILGGMIIPSRQKLGFLTIAVPPLASSYYGLLLDERGATQNIKNENQRNAVTNAILDFAEGKLDLITSAFLPEFSDIRVFNWRKYSARVLYTYRGDISDPEKVMDEILPDIRRRVKKGDELDYIIRDTLDAEHVSTVYDLLKSSFARQEHNFVFSKDLFLDILQNEQLKDDFRIFSIWQDQIPVAALVFIIDGKKTYYWLAGGDHAYFKTGLNQVLLWEAIKKLSAEGCSSLDMVGANTPTVSNYKSGMNFELLPYFTVSKASSKAARFLYFMRGALTGRTI